MYFISIVHVCREPIELVVAIALVNAEIEPSAGN